MGTAGEEFSGTIAPSARETVVRLFVSSTFRDFRIERDALQTHVYPRLRRFCARLGLRFQPIDLRWGVSPGASLDQQTMNLCLDELRRCQAMTPRPNFLVLVGNLYGWRPLRSEIPADEFSEILAVLGHNERRMLCWSEDSVEGEGWYRKDENAVPAEYVLRPRWEERSLEIAGKESGRSGALLHRPWRKIEADLGTIFAAALNKLPWPADDPRRQRYTDSATHQEIRLGALDACEAEHHVLCCLRRFRNPPQPTETGAGNFIDLLTVRDGASGEKSLPDLVAATRLKELRALLRRRFQPTGNLFEYQVDQLRALAPPETAPLAETANARHTDPLLHLDPDTAQSLFELCRTVYRHLRRVIRREYVRLQTNRGQDWFLAHENAAHEAFGAERASCFVGRGDLLRQIDSYLLNDNTRPLVFVGPAGSGKTALLARVAQRARASSVPGEVRHVVTRFIGATSNASDWRLLLDDLCRQLYGKLNLEVQMQERLAAIADEESPAADQARLQIRADYQVGGDSAALLTRLKFFLQQVPDADQLVIILDALDQFGNCVEVASALPAEFPRNVKCVFSALEVDASTPDPLPRLLRGRWPSNTISVEGLTSVEGSELLQKWLERAGDQAIESSGAAALNGLTSRRRRTLQPEQRDEILAKFSGAARGLPLYLRLAYEEARRWRSYDHRSPVGQFTSTGLSPTLHGLLEQLFDRLEEPRHHGPLLTRRALAFLAAARNGLTEDELLDLLSDDRDLMQEFVRRSPTELAKAETNRLTKLPTLLWSRLYADLEPFLNVRAADGTVLLSYYHRVVGETAGRRYLNGLERLQRHQQLARYFDGQDWWLGSNDERRSCVLATPAVPRRTNRRALAELPWHLLRTAVLAREAGDVRAADLALGRLGSLFTTLGFLEASAEAGIIYQLSADLHSAVKVSESDRAQQRTLKLLDTALRADLVFLGQTPTALFQCLWNRGWWFDSAESEFHYDPPATGWGTELAPWNRPDSQKLSRLVEVWQTEKEREYAGFRWMRSLFPPQKYLESAEVAAFQCDFSSTRVVAFSPDDKTIAIAGPGGISLVDSATGITVGTLRAIGRELSAVAFEEIGSEVIGVTGEGQVVTWSTNDEVPRRTVTLEGYVAGDCVLAANGETVAALQTDSNMENEERSSIWLWNARTGSTRAVLPLPPGVCETLAISGDGSCVVVGMKSGGVFVGRSTFSSMSSAWQTSLWSHISKDSIACVALDDGGERIAVVDNTRQVIVVDRTGVVITTVAKTGSFGSRPLGLSPDGRWLVTESAPRLILWSVAQGVAVTSFEATEGSRYALTVAVARSGNLIAALYEGEWVRIWDATNCSPVPMRHGHQPGWAAGMVHRIELSRDARRFATIADDHSINVWDTNTGRSRLTIVGSMQMRTHLLSISGTGSRLAWAPDLDEIRVVDVDQNLDVVTVDFSHPDLLALSTDGSMLAAGSYREICVWKLPNREPITILEHSSRGLTALAVSSDGLYAVSAHEDETVHLWDVRQGRQMGFLKLGWMDSIHHLAFSADSSQIFGISPFYNLMRVWDASSGRWRRRMTLPGRTIPADRADCDLCLGAVITNGRLEIQAQESEITLAAIPFWGKLSGIHSDPTTVARTTFRTDGRVWGLTDYQSISLYRLEGDVQTHYSASSPQRNDGGLHFRSETRDFTVDGEQPRTQQELWDQQQPQRIRALLEDFEAWKTQLQDNDPWLERQTVGNREGPRVSKGLPTLRVSYVGYVIVFWCVVAGLSTWIARGWTWGWLLWLPVVSYGLLRIFDVTIQFLGWVKVLRCPLCNEVMVTVPALQMELHDCPKKRQ